MELGIGVEDRRPVRTFVMVATFAGDGMMENPRVMYIEDFTYEIPFTPSFADAAIKQRLAEEGA